MKEKNIILNEYEWVLLLQQVLQLNKKLFDLGFIHTDIKA